MLRFVILWLYLQWCVEEDNTFLSLEKKGDIWTSLSLVFTWLHSFHLGHQREATALHLALTWINLGTTFKCVSINIHTPCHVFSVESWHWGVRSAVFHTRKVTCYLNANQVPKNGARIWNDFSVVAVGCFGTSLLIMWLTVDHARAAWLNYFIPFMAMQKPAGVWLMICVPQNAKVWGRFLSIQRATFISVNRKQFSGALSNFSDTFIGC